MQLVLSRITGRYARTKHADGIPSAIVEPDMAKHRTRARIGFLSILIESARSASEVVMTVNERSPAGRSPFRERSDVIGQSRTSCVRIRARGSKPDVAARFSSEVTDQ